MTLSWDNQFIALEASLSNSLCKDAITAVFNDSSITSQSNQEDNELSQMPTLSFKHLSSGLNHRAHEKTNSLQSQFFPFPQVKHTLTSNFFYFGVCIYKQDHFISRFVLSFK